MCGAVVATSVLSLIIQHQLYFQAHKMNISSQNFVPLLIKIYLAEIKRYSLENVTIVPIIFDLLEPSPHK